MTDPDHPIRRFLDQAAGLAAGLPFSSLLPGQARRLTHKCYPDDPLLIEELATALLSRPHLFPDLADLGEELRRGVGELPLWDRLIAHLELWLKHARDSKLAAQSGLVQQVMLALHRIDLQDQLWATSLTDQQRGDPAWQQGDLLRFLLRQQALGPVRLLLHQRRAMSRNGKAKDSKRKKATGPGRAAARALLERVLGKGPAGG